ncbi:Glutamyl-tRNA(Gln) amidotransferase subunit A [Vitis vinifera]|uniref:Glutamyl-tRNA(Gln) amidotransferase subunit A n=1 Tax=Vitis vinifera TaxID=29760 RepID=A0A438GL28_VITVI|nr:Glutamyl-tRNA(Gln) amidotransferase subunit A [Vitis vinifera]
MLKKEANFPTFSFSPLLRKSNVLLFFDQDSGEYSPKSNGECSEKITEASPVKCAFAIFDADFFNDTKIAEIEQGATKLNIPISGANRKSVASVNGGLHDPSYLVFNPEWGNEQVQSKTKRFSCPSLSGIQRPEGEEDIAFMTVLELGELIKTKQITSEELTRIFLHRLKRYNLVLEAVVTYTEELAYKQAKEADEMLARGIYLGPLHGIPYGLKDIISVPQYKTTWGSKTFKDQVLDIEASVYKKLKSAGAVLVAKLATGSLAYDDIWFGGRTRNPWNIEEYSTGSSSGPAASTSAGMVPFAIGSETCGSITYPAARCGVTALRPTFGAVGRTGVMSISESLDKIGPFCRSAADCTIILDAILGKDPDDPSSKDISLDDPLSVDITNLTVGYLDDAEMEVVRILESKGVKMVPFKLNYTVSHVQGILNFTMDVDMLAHFDEWQRSGEDDFYEAQDQWPVELRRARRDSCSRLCSGFTKIFSLPPDGSQRRTTITTGIYAPPNHDHVALALAMAYQSVTKHHKQRPPIDDLGPNDFIGDSISTPDYLSSQAIPCLEGSVSSGSAVTM